MKVSNFILFCMLFASCLPGMSQDVLVRAVLDTNKGLIGDQFTLRLQVEKPADWKITFPAVADSLGGRIEIMDILPVDTATKSNGQVLTQDLLITVFDTGFFEIPAMPFGIHHASVSDTISSLPVFFEIQAMKVDSTIRDIKGIYKVPVSFREIAPFLGGAVLLGLIAWLLTGYIRKRRARVPQKATEVFAEQPDIVALRELVQLREEKPWLNNRIKYYYIRISDILRTYIERRYHTLAMEQTTGEILISLTNRNIESADLKRLSDILKLADLVKFAKVIPDPEKNALQVKQAEEFVRNSSLVLTEKIRGEEIVESNR